MKIFLDTAEVDQIIDGYKTGLVDNPTLRKINRKSLKKSSMS